ncbi:hypothetical protein [Companilactobacillus hulinensis]|uniref:hypothetical protein n=1 Tax=Companilactobacillus hulinensis TaxID=2486007 RepID=UPI0013DD947B|nr:hypothetical protein [Companilactobacillus hulinensis]
MKTFNFEDLLKEKMKNEEFKNSFEKEYQRLTDIKVNDDVVKCDFRNKTSAEKKYM